nr:glutathione S-transferase family protein [Halomonas endophytica]
MELALIKAASHRTRCPGHHESAPSCSCLAGWRTGRRSAAGQSWCAEHFTHQPFGQVPWLTDGDLTIFESGAILLHLGERSDALMPTDPHRRNEVIEWLFAALNSVEMASLPWSLFMFTGDTEVTPGRQMLDKFLNNCPQRNGWLR